MNHVAPLMTCFKDNYPKLNSARTEEVHVRRPGERRDVPQASGETVNDSTPRQDVETDDSLSLC